MDTFSYNKVILLLISNIIIVSSSGRNHDRESPPACKWTVLENCSESICTVDIKVINKCSKNSSSDDKTKKKCENFVEADFLNDTFIFRPVTNELKNVTYLNRYCALCNGEKVPSKYFKYWTLQVRLRGHSGSNSICFESDVNLAVVENIQVDNNTQKLISNSDSFVGNVELLRFLPSGLSSSSYQGCSSDTSECIMGVVSKNSTESLSSVPEGFNCTGKKFCSKRKLPEPGVCVYLDRNNLGCTENRFLDESIGDFVYNGSEIILKDGKIFDSNAYSNFSDKVIFLCDSKDSRGLARRIIHEFAEFMMYVSTFLLFVFFIVEMKNGCYKSLPKLNMNSYCVATFARYLYQILHHLIIGPVIYRTYTFLYVHICQALWVAIISYECCFLISRPLILINARSKMKTYRIYGFIGWVLPALLLGAVYPWLTAEDKSAICPWVANYKCITVSEYLSEVPLNVYLLVIICYELLFLILTLVMVWQGFKLYRQSKKDAYFRRQSTAKLRLTKNSIHIRNESDRDYWFIFIKIAYLMGFHWMVLCIACIVWAIFGGSSVVADVGTFLSACHGTFIFFAFGFKTMLELYTSIYQPFKKKSARSRVTESDSVEMSPPTYVVNELGGQKKVGEN